jgi:AraC-like DNA-binding protein
MSKLIREITPISDDDFFVVLNHFNAKFDFPVHFHPEYEINLVSNSGGKRIIGDSIQDFGNLDMVMTGPNLPHAWVGSEKFENAHVITIQFQSDFFSETTLNRKLIAPIKELLLESKRGVLFSQETTEFVIPKFEKLSSSQSFDSFLEFLSLLYDLSISRNKKVLATASYSGHLNPKRTQRSFSDYLTEIRLGNAARLLVQSEKNISEICYESGYNNISNFNRNFKKKYGYTPSEFRSQQILITKH